MRCPKCGFISFDHLTSCAKCGKDIAEVASELQGTSIKVETPMFLSGALGSFADRQRSFEEHAMESEVEEGIDFSMDEGVAEEPVAMAEGGEDIDFSFDEAEPAGIRLGGETGEAKARETADFALEAEAVSGDVEEAIEELDLMSSADDEEESSLEFDLDDFLEDMDEGQEISSDREDVDINLDDEEK